jgi:hypothetical protein
MKLRDTFLAYFCCLIFGFVCFGCSENRPLKLDKDDIRFAGFYSDYLQISGVTHGDESSQPAVLNSAELDTLLVHHLLTRERMSFKVQLYRQHPDLWRLVLVQVRENLHKKTSPVR